MAGTNMRFPIAGVRTVVFEATVPVLEVDPGIDEVEFFRSAVELDDEIRVI